jgi:hypothetical protein
MNGKGSSTSSNWRGLVATNSCGPHSLGSAKSVCGARWARRGPRAATVESKKPTKRSRPSLFVWLVADGWCWFVLREKYCSLVASGWFVLREKYCWLMTDKPSEQGGTTRSPGQGLPASAFGNTESCMVTLASRYTPQNYFTQWIYWSNIVISIYVAF